MVVALAAVATVRAVEREGEVGGLGAVAGHGHGHVGRHELRVGCVAPALVMRTAGPPW